MARVQNRSIQETDGGAVRFRQESRHLDHPTKLKMIATGWYYPDDATFLRGLLLPYDSPLPVKLQYLPKSSHKHSISLNFC